MIPISRQLEALNHELVQSVLNCKAQASFVRLYQTTLILKFAETLMDAKALEAAHQTGGLWATNRSLAELFIRCSWVGLDHNRAAHITIGERYKQKNRLAQYIAKVKKAEKLGRTDVDALNGKAQQLHDTIKAEVDELATRIPLDPQYWNASCGAFKNSPSTEEMAEITPTSDEQTKADEKQRFMVYATYFAYGSWYVHGSATVLAEFFLDSGTEIPNIATTALNEDEFASGRRAAIVLATAFAALITRFDFPVDTEKVERIGESLAALFEEG